MSKYNKEQEQAIDSLVHNLDELNNKPRRLFHDLESLYRAFYKEGDESERLDACEIIYDIRNAKDMYYFYANRFSNLQSLLETVEKLKREIGSSGLMKKEDESQESHDYRQGYGKGGLDACENFYALITEKMFEIEKGIL